MSQGLMHKIKTWVAGDPFEDEAYGYDMTPMSYPAEDAAYAPVAEYDEPKKARKNLRVVDHPSAVTQTVLVVEPRAFEESLDIIDHLRAKKAVLLNLHLLDTAQSQRVVDFLSGATHAIDGHQQRIGDGVFMFTPNNVVITHNAEVKPMAVTAPAPAPLTMQDPGYWNLSTAAH